MLIGIAAIVIGVAHMFGFNINFVPIAIVIAVVMFVSKAG